MPKHQGERIYGPYRDESRKQWRVFVHDATGRRVAESFASAAEAEQFCATVRDRAQTRTVGRALDGYLASMIRRGTLESSVATTRWRLEGLHDVVLGNPLSALTAKLATELYDTYATNRAVDTHRNALGQARTAGKFWVRQGWLKVNPWESVEPQGRRKRRKRQLKLDQSRALMQVCLVRAESDVGALAVATMLLLGIRSSELCRISSADLDCDGTVLLIPESKTEAGVRELELPAVLVPLLRARAAVSARLFPHRRWWVRDQVQRFCAVAGLKPVTAHALRGMHATIAIRRGVSAHAVAAALGHSSPVVTQQHYVAPGTVREIFPDFSRSDFSRQTGSDSEG